jgi:type 2 lantibiotic biosynthesis protein LanM
MGASPGRASVAATWGRARTLAERAQTRAGEDVGRSPPRWARRLVAALGRRRRNGAPSSGVDALLVAVEPLLREGQARLARRIADLPWVERELAPQPRWAARCLWRGLPEKLLTILSRTLVLEMHVTALRGQLTGDTPGARFQAFVRLLAHPRRATALFGEYPVLGRVVVETIDAWIDASEELARRLHDDWADLQRAYGLVGPLRAIARDAGDTHGRGRAVAILVFATGGRVVYKPRSLAVEAGFQRLLAWMGGEPGIPPLRCLHILDRGAHGWEEHVEATECRSPREVERFYRRLGVLLAAMHAFRGTDVHHENLIAAGEHPVIVDLETVFQPLAAAPAPESALEAAHRRFATSVLGVLLLPFRVATGAASVDLSGMARIEGQLTAERVPSWQGAATDQMRLVSRRAPLAPSHNCPRLDGAEVDPAGYTTELETGFGLGYRRLMHHREELLAQGGLLSTLADLRVRAIVRPTQVYGSLLFDSYHPDLLRDGLDRDKHLDRLWQAVPETPALRRLVGFERRDLSRGDIPLFTTRPSSHDLWTADGEHVPDFFATTGLQAVTARLRGLGEEDLSEQRALIRAAMASTVSGAGEVTGVGGEAPSDAPPTRPDREALIGAATAIGDRICQRAIRLGEQATWLSLTRLPEGVTIAPLGLDLYEGLAGVCLFLAQLGDLAREPGFCATARAAAAAMAAQETATALSGVGAFVGWSGALYALAQLARRWDDAALWRRARALLPRVRAGLDADRTLDLVGGAAGALAVAASLRGTILEDEAHDLAVRCGEHLLGNALEVDGGLAWPAEGSATAPLAGLSHGVAGIAWALALLAAWTGEDRFLVAASRSLDYERTLFYPEQGNWVHLQAPGAIPAEERARGGRGTFTVAWCHGAAGIGLARLAMPAAAEDPRVARDREHALAATARCGFAHAPTLCHGSLGNIELLLAAERRGDGRWRAAIDCTLTDASRRARQGRGLSEYPLDVEVPGLMTGLAGTGHALLRAADPAAVPSVLLLEGGP